MKRINPEYADFVINRVKNAPYPSHMAMELVLLDIDRAVVEIQLSTNHLQPYGIVHGGVIATIIDTATFWAAFGRIPQGNGLVNIDLKLNYLKSVIDGKLVAEGNCIRPGKTISYSEARVYDKNNELVAHGTSSLMTLPGKGLGVPHKKILE